MRFVGRAWRGCAAPEAAAMVQYFDHSDLTRDDGGVDGCGSGFQRSLLRFGEAASSMQIA
jgi:hypothetical protein